MRHRMSGILAATCAVLVCNSLLAIQPMDDELEFPYHAFAIGDQAMVRSGPDEVHYATEHLKAGDSVQVYRHDPGGWCAIRPTRGSFSMIPQSVVEIVEESIGRVVEDDTQVWVGTRLGAVEKPLWQVKLREGELIEILGEVSWPDPEGHSVIWYQIAPPSGEFRWIHRSHLQLPQKNGAIALKEKLPQTIEVDETDVTAAPPQISLVSVEPLLDSLAASPSPRIGRKVETSAEADSESRQIVDHRVRQAVLEEPPLPDQPVTRKENSLDDGWRVVSRSRPRKQARSDPAPPNSTNELPNRFTSPTIPEINPVNVHRNPEQYTDSANHPPSMGPRYASAVFDPGRDRTPRVDAATEFSRARSDRIDPIGEVPKSSLGKALQQLDLRLSQEILKAPRDWIVGSIAMEVENLLNQSIDPAERTYANRILRKIDDCRTLRSKYLLNDGTMSSLQGDGPVGSGVATEVELGTTYDAYGYLNQLARNGGTTKAEFVLQDANGKITHHISPSPGLNLHRYLKSRVGIIGQRGYHQRFNLDHVTAERVVELNRLR